jgi:hypothetical protein
MVFEDDDDDFCFDEDGDAEGSSCLSAASGCAEPPKEAFVEKSSPQESGCCYCGIVGCGSCTHHEIYALDLLSGFCRFALKQTGDVDQSIHLIQSLCDELVLVEHPDGWAEWIGDVDTKVATIATRAIRHEDFLRAILAWSLAKPGDPRRELYLDSERRALEEVRAKYPDDLRSRLDRGKAERHPREGQAPGKLEIVPRRT